MALLNPADRNRLLSIDGLNRFVNRNRERYVRMLREWKPLLAMRPELRGPDMLAHNLKGVLMYEQDSPLFPLLRDIFGNDDAAKLQYIDFLARHFVDLEAGA